MHGSKKFIVVGNAYAYARWSARVPLGDGSRKSGTRLKRSRHRSSVDVYLIPETDVKWVGRRYGRAPAPKWWRKVLNRRYRARIQRLLYMAKFDLMHAPVRDGSWYW